MKNSTLAMFDWGIPGTLEGVPYPGVWNGSLWTLVWEFLCYLGLLGLGLLGMLRRPWLLPAALLGSVFVNVASLSGLVDAESVQRVARFSIFFLAGAAVAAYAHRIPATWTVLVLASAITAVGAVLPWGRLFQAPAVALALILLGGMVNPGWATLRNDISYGVYIYGFPLQQILVVAGLATVNVLVFSAIALALTVPLALGSWFLVEKPSLRLRKRLGYRSWFSRRLGRT